MKKAYSIPCGKHDLIRALSDIGRGLKDEEVLLEHDERGFRVYYGSSFDGEGVSIHVWPAVRIRMESSISELHERILEEKALLRVSYRIKKVYCCVRYVDIVEDFLITDVYMGYEDP